jgi:hypothetical protein
MKMRGCIGYLFVSVLLLSSTASCSDLNKELVAGRYYTTYSEDGYPILYFDDPQLGMTKLDWPSRVGTAKGYVASCGDSCYLFSAAAATADAARHSRIGPFPDFAACRRKVFQLTGDSLKMKSLVEF